MHWIVEVRHQFMDFHTWLNLNLTAQTKGPIPQSGIEAVLKLAAEGSTVAFIARYRKEATNNLEDIQIQNIIEGFESYNNVLKRQKFILEEIEKQGKLDDALRSKISSTYELEKLEDLYLPYKQKRKTKGAIAKENGLEPLADFIRDVGALKTTPEPQQTLELWATTFTNEKIKDAAAAIDGATDILIERLAEQAELRDDTRALLNKEGFVRTTKGPKANPHSKFELYFEYAEPISKLLEPQNSHRYLAMRRGWMEEELTLSLGGAPNNETDDPDQKDSGFQLKLLKRFERQSFSPDFESAASKNILLKPYLMALKKAARFALKAHVFTSIESETHTKLKAIADEAAIQVFAENVRKLLLAPPFGPKAVLAVDPGLRTGCKVALVSDSGHALANTVFDLQSERGKQQVKTSLKEVISKANVKAVAVGNGTAGRETEVFLRSTLKELGDQHIPVVMVSEAGASVYSASEVARKEFPELDVTVRGAISIGRRLQDPLAELVKIDPKSIGVGQYQHDVSQPQLKKSLEFVVDSCVNQVGVNLNTASEYLLSHVSGIGPGLAKAVVSYRGEKGLFKSREALLDVPRFTKKAFEQAAGFLKIPEASNPLDNTGVHPERYKLLEDYAAKMGKSVTDFIGPGAQALRKDPGFKEQVGAFTLEDIITELEKPGRDPRAEFQPFQYREDIHTLQDLQPGMWCAGIVTNVTNFGAFVDIGVHQDGLVHISQLADKFVKDPREVVSPGDRVQAKVVSVDLAKNQIALSLRKQEAREYSPNATSPKAAPNASPNMAQRGKGPTPNVGPRPSAPRPSTGGRPTPSPRQPEVFNNAFAGLAGLKAKLK